MLQAVLQQQKPFDAFTAFGSPGTSDAVLFLPFPCLKGDCPWKVGMENALAQARASGIPCEYYFTSDDDSDWFLSDDPKVLSGTSTVPHNTVAAVTV